MKRELDDYARYFEKKGQQHAIVVRENTGGGWFLPVLTLLFIALKLTGYIGWSWWWVLAPLWMPVALLVVVGLVFVALYLAFNR